MNGPVEKSKTFVIGGACSGKSVFAESLVGRSTPAVYVATALPIDEEMKERIAIHQARRPLAWKTIEALSLDLPAILDESDGETVILDSLALYLAWALEQAGDVDGHLHKVVEAIDRCAANLVIVSDEVGMGLVPGPAGARRFCDLLGKTNQQIAAMADRVFLVAAGVPVAIK